MKRKDPKAIKALTQHARYGKELASLPDLAQFLTAAQYEGGERRESPTITVWCQGGQWKASVKDRAEGLVMWLSAESPLELLQMLETFVLADEAPWRYDTPGPNQGKRQKRD